MPALSQVRSRLWTPEGEVPLQSDVIVVKDPMERVTFVRMHEIAQKYGIALVCQRCNTSIMGKNNGQEAIPAVSCQCREFQFVR